MCLWDLLRVSLRLALRPRRRLRWPERDVVGCLCLFRATAPQRCHRRPRFTPAACRCLFRPDSKPPVLLRSFRNFPQCVALLRFCTRPPLSRFRPVHAPRVAYRGAALLPAGNVSRRLLLGLCTLPGMGGVGDSTSAQVAAHNATAGLTRGFTAEDRRRAGSTGRRAGLAVGSAFGGLGVGSVADASATSEGAARLSGYLARAYAPSTNKRDAGAFIAWERACAKMGTTPWRTDMAANSGADRDGYAEEVYVAAMGVVLMYDEMRPRSHADPAADPRNATKKYGAVIRIHSCLWPPVKMVPTSVVANVVKGMMRVFIDRHGFKSLIPRRKLPLTNAMLAAMFGIYEGAKRGALVFVSTAYEWIAMMALFMVLAESGERKDDRFLETKVATVSLSPRSRGRSAECFTTL